MRAADIYRLLTAAAILASISPSFAADDTRPPGPGQTGRATPSGTMLEGVTMPYWMVRLPSWMSPTTPNVGSPAWKREQAETALQERAIRQAITGVCRGC